jgi:hypothetical protein
MSRYVISHSKRIEVEEISVPGAAAVPKRKQSRVFPPKGAKYTAFLESWINRLDASRRPSATMYRAALAIQRAATLQNTLTPTLPNGPLGMHRTAKYRALARLTKLGLIRLEQGTGSAPIVHVALESEAI